MKSDSRIGVLFSGGLDSAALVGHLLETGRTVYPIYVRNGLPWEALEIRWCRRYLDKIANKRLRPLKIIRLNLESAYDKNWSFRGRPPGRRTQDTSVFLPARNLLLVTKALLYLSSKRIFFVALGTLKGNPFRDGHKRYFKRLERLLTESFNRPVRVLVPFAGMTKSSIIRKSARWPVHISLSCINPKGNAHCGKCNKCAERRRAFKRAGISDETLYVHF